GWPCGGGRRSRRPWRAGVGGRRECALLAGPAPSRITRAPATALPCAPTPAMPRMRRSRASTRPGAFWRHTCPHEGRRKRMATNRRQQIQLNPDEQTAFFRERKKAALATIDKDGFPHVVAMNYFAR